MNVVLSEDDWRTVVEALSHTITILDEINPSLLLMEGSEKHRFAAVLPKITAQLVAELDRQDQVS